MLEASAGWSVASSFKWLIIPTTGLVIGIVHKSGYLKDKFGF